MLYRHSLYQTSTVASCQNADKSVLIIGLERCGIHRRGKAMSFNIARVVIHENLVFRSLNKSCSNGVNTMHSGLRSPQIPRA